MLVGTAMPNKISAIDSRYRTSGVDPSFQRHQHLPNRLCRDFGGDRPPAWLAIGAVWVDADVAGNTVNILAFALDARTGNIVWTQTIGGGKIPAGFVAPTPVIVNNSVYFHNPISKTSVALDTASGAIRWQTQVDVTDASSVGVQV